MAFDKSKPDGNPIGTFRTDGQRGRRSIAQLFFRGCSKGYNLIVVQHCLANSLFK